MSQHFEYLTISTAAEGLYKEKGSKFVGYAFPCASADEFSEELKKIKTKHHTARHHCYAYAFGPDGSNYRTNDDGEPSGTAGRPIHGQIRSFELSNVGIVVVRYFGGTKLGASGLIRAYRSAAKYALEQAQVIKVELNEELRIVYPSEATGPVMRAVEKAEARIVKQHYHENNIMVVEVKLRMEESLRKSLDQIPSVRLQ